MKNKNGKTISFGGKIILIIFVVIAFLITWSIFKQVQKEKLIKDEITKLQQEASKISQENVLIQERISYFESREYKEREAKERLNLKDSGESVVVIKPGIIKKGEPENQQQEESLTTSNFDSRNNFIKWWAYFTRY